MSSGTHLLNPRLYTALLQRFGEVHVVNGGNPGKYACPKAKEARRLKAASESSMAKVIEWGEIYRVKCPKCSDKKSRLYISYFTGTSVSTTTGKNTSGEKTQTGWYQFGNVYHCHNESCNLRDVLTEVIAEAGSLIDVVTESPSTYTGGIVEDVDLPFSYPLTSSMVPPHVLDYVHGRRYSPEMLENLFDIRYMPKGTLLGWNSSEGIPVKSWDDRLLIPISRAGRIIGWQARVASNNITKNTKKYIFPPAHLTGGVGKSTWLYNMAQASYRKDLVLVEGVTDVWRIGPNAVGSFGKGLSEEQKEMLYVVWGSFASCVVVYDGDAWEQTRELVAFFREHKYFSGGVTALRLPVGYDPDSYSTEDINKYIEAQRKLCS